MRSAGPRLTELTYDASHNFQAVFLQCTFSPLLIRSATLAPYMVVRLRLSPTVEIASASDPRSDSRHWRSDAN
jgi:hypothetical protein